MVVYLLVKGLHSKQWDGEDVRNLGNVEKETKRERMHWIPCFLGESNTHKKFLFYLQKPVSSVCNVNVKY